MTTKQTITKLHTQIDLKLCVVLALLTSILIYVGFALDGITEIGHHACFILAGIYIGIGISRLKK